jgi:hypothetical protein
LQYIADASIGTCHGRDEIKFRSNSILDHFPDIGRSNVERFQSKHRCIFLAYSLEHLLYTLILLLQYIADASIGNMSRLIRNKAEDEFHPGPFSQY